MKEKKTKKNVSCILRANEQTENTYINMWTHLETQNMCMLGDSITKGAEKPSLRELEQQIRRDIDIDSTGKKMICPLNRTHRGQMIKKQREQLMRLLKEDKLGARSIDTIKPSDAKEWALRMKDKGFSYNTINNHKRSLKASFYIAIQDDCVF